jgi:hypothetical protein
MLNVSTDPFLMIKKIYGKEDSGQFDQPGRTSKIVIHNGSALFLPGQGLWLRNVCGRIAGIYVSIAFIY